MFLDAFMSSVTSVSECDHDENVGKIWPWQLHFKCRNSKKDKIVYIDNASVISIYNTETHVCA